MSSILSYLANQQDVPLRYQDGIQELLANNIENTQAVHINLYCPGRNSQQLPKSKWALIFTCESDLHAFIQEVDESEDKQTRLSIDEYSVFGNVMFAFMHRQYKMTVWVTHIRDHIVNQPKAILIFKERFRQLSELVEKGVRVNYQIDWRFEMVPRKYNRKNESDENNNNLSESSDEKKSRQQQKSRHNHQQGSEEEDREYRKILKRSPLDESNQTQKGHDLIQNYLEKSKKSPYEFECDSKAEVFDVLRDFSIRMLEKLNHLNDFFSGFVGVLSQIQAQNQDNTINEQN